MVNDLPDMIKILKGIIPNAHQIEEDPHPDTSGDYLVYFKLTEYSISFASIEMLKRFKFYIRSGKYDEPISLLVMRLTPIREVKPL